jgi:hypothetical protein
MVSNSIAVWILAPAPVVHAAALRKANAVADYDLH